MSNLSTYQIWTLSPKWNPTLCHSAVPIYVDIELNNQDGRDLGILTVSNFSLQLLPSNLSQPTEGDLVKLWSDNWAANASGMSIFVQSINNRCNDQICDQVGFDGNPDISGIGMIIVYGTLLALVALYTIALTILAALATEDKEEGNLPGVKNENSTPPEVEDDTTLKADKKNIGDAFRGTITPLFDACLAFTITAEISTIAFHRIAVTKYEMVVAELLCVFSSVACITLWCFLYKITRFRLPRFCLYVVSWILPIGVAMAHGLMKEGGMKDFVMMCVDQRLGDATNSKLRTGFMLGSWGLMTLSQIFNWEKITIWKGRVLWRRERLGRWVTRLAPFIGCGVMIYCLWDITYLRKKMKERAGSEYNEDSWGFGQIYALTTWFPILISFGYIFFRGARDGFESHLPNGWLAIRKGFQSCGCDAEKCTCLFRKKKTTKSSYVISLQDLGPPLSSEIIGKHGEKQEEQQALVEEAEIKIESCCSIGE